MRFIYGKQDWKTFERGEEACYLMTNGLGGFSSLSLIGSCSRNDQAVFIACTHSPNHRYNMIHRLEETFAAGDKKVFLSSQDFQIHGKRETGYLYQSCFCFEDYPKWTYLMDGAEVTRSIVLEQGKNTLGISYQIKNRSGKDVTLTVAPHLQFVPKGVRLGYHQEFAMTDSVISSNGQCLYYRTNGSCVEVDRRFCDTLYYSSDVEDGKMSLGHSVVTHEITFAVPAGREDTLEIVYSTEPLSPENGVCVQQIIDNVKAYRNALKEQAGYEDPIATQLAVSADQFISYRASTDGKTILAGFPFFEDWGRDTMIALVGCCLSSRQFETTESILRTFMAYCDKGLMPNLFPEGGNKPLYNTVDAALLFVVAVYEYYRRTTNLEFVKEAYPIMKEIVTWYRKGTDFHIHMDKDGLISAGSGLEQVTWMDVRVENILPTPRHGKPVEINAYWYNALMIMDMFAKELGEDTVLGALDAEDGEGTSAVGTATGACVATVDGEDTGAVGTATGACVATVDGEDTGAVGTATGACVATVDGEDTGAVGTATGACKASAACKVSVDCTMPAFGKISYADLAAIVKESFLQQFWNAEKDCLKDVISGSSADEQIRCNQIWAISMPFSLLPREQEKAVVETVFRKLYTPYGLRTLAPEDAQFRPFYGGAQLDRDMAYHQGTVWPFPMGGYYLAYLKVNDYSEAAKAYVKEQLDAIEAALREGCIGQIAEIYDGENPVSSKGCFAQAWSVGEILRVYDALR